MHRQLLPALAVAAIVSPPLHAQTQRSLPLHADAVDGHRDHWLPFGTPGFRTQILADVSAIAPTGGTVSGIAFRADRPRTLAAAQQVPNVTITLSQTATAVGAMSATFASNITGTPTVVFQGTVSLPAMSPGLVVGPQPWNVVITFPTPFQFTTSSGNLLIDIKANNAPGTIAPTWYLDAVQAGGSASTFGQPGHNPTGDYLFLGASNAPFFGEHPPFYSPGHTVDFLSFLDNPTPGLFFLGTTAPLVPIDLGPIGAPTHLLYVDPLLLSAHSWLPAPLGGWYSKAPIVVPNNPQLIGVVLYGQSMIFEPLANALGMAFGGAIEMRIGDQFEQLPLQQIDAWDPNLAHGVRLDFGAPLVPAFASVPVQFHGTFF